MELETWMWVAFAAFVLALLLVDLLAFGRRGEEIPFRRAVTWSIAWTAVGAGFGGLLWAWQGRVHAEEYRAGFVTGIRMTRHADVEIHPDRNPVLRLLGRVLPLTTRYDGDRLTVREGGRRVATPMLAALAMIATFDVVFAVDSIPAIFAVTRETFVVYAANAFSLLGLSALYFVLAGMIGRFRYLNVGLAAVLVFVGAKMTLADVVHIPVYVSLGVIVLTLAASVGASLLRAEPVPREGTA